MHSKRPSKRQITIDSQKPAQLLNQTAIIDKTTHKIAIIKTLPAILCLWDVNLANAGVAIPAIKSPTITPKGK